MLFSGLIDCRSRRCICTDVWVQVGFHKPCGKAAKSGCNIKSLVKLVISQPCEKNRVIIYCICCICLKVFISDILSVSYIPPPHTYIHQHGICNLWNANENLSIKQNLVEAFLLQDFFICVCSPRSHYVFKRMQTAYLNLHTYSKDMHACMCSQSHKSVVNQHIKPFMETMVCICKWAMILQNVLTQTEEINKVGGRSLGGMTHQPSFSAVSHMVLMMEVENSFGIFQPQIFTDQKMILRLKTAYSVVQVHRSPFKAHCSTV